MKPGRPAAGESRWDAPNEEKPSVMTAPSPTPILDRIAAHRPAPAPTPALVRRPAWLARLAPKDLTGTVSA